MDTQTISRKVAKHIKENYSPPLHTMDLFLTHDCNFRCDYCFVGEKWSAYMSEEIAIKGINFLFRESANVQTVHIVFFGGEPLLNIGVLKAAVQHGRGMGKYYGKQISLGMTTNGSLLSEEICEYLKEVNISPMVSIDGSAERHNRHRIYADGRGTFQDAMRGLMNVLKTHGFVGVRMTVSPESVNSLYYDVVWLYKSVGVTSFTICHNTDAEWTADEVNVYLRQMRRINDYCLSEVKRLRGFRLQDNTSLAGFIDHGKSGRPCSAGSTSIAVSPEGNLYPCSRFVQRADYCIGTVDEGRVFNKALREILCYQKEAESRCRFCKIEHICTGGCMAVNLDQTGNIQRKSERDCKVHTGLIWMLVENRELLRFSRPGPISGTQNTCIY